MTSDEFAKNFYLEKLAFLKLCFEKQTHPSAVNVKIKEMALSSTQKEQLEAVIDLLLNDVFYSVLSIPQLIYETQYSTDKNTVYF